jgi:hypothetical protein
VSTGPERWPTEFCLRIGPRIFRLHTGEVLLGRGLGADVVLDDSKASRQHARLTVTQQRVVVMDLGSVNGSFLDERPLSAVPTPLPVGSRLRLGHTVVELVQQPIPAQEVTTGALVPQDPTSFVLGEEDIPTLQYQALDIAGAGAELAYAAGRPDQAERLLSGYLASILDELTARRDLPERTVHESARLALRLAAKTRKPAWFDYSIQVLLRARRLPGVSLTGELCDVGGGLRFDRSLLSRYIDEMARGADAASGPLLARLSELAAAAPATGPAD